MAVTLLNPACGDCYTCGGCDWNGCTQPSSIELTGTYVDSPQFEDVDGSHAVGTYTAWILPNSCSWNGIIWLYTDPLEHTVGLFIATQFTANGGNWDYRVDVAVIYTKETFDWRVDHNYEWELLNSSTCPSAGQKTMSFVSSITQYGSPPSGTAPSTVKFTI